MLHHAISCRPSAFYDAPGVENMKTWNVGLGGVGEAPG